MAALLLRSRYGYKQDSDQILVDDQPCASFEQRREILAQHQGIAIKADELLAMNKEQGREAVRPWQVIYIYHNQIDATGDSASTETKTFSAVRKTIAELSSLVRFIVNSLNGYNVLVTADSVSWGREEQARAMCTRRSAPTAFWFLVDRPQWPTCSTT
jgi:two-component SAPR family response regulator